MYCSQCGSPVNNSGTCSVCGHVQAAPSDVSYSSTSGATPAYAGYGKRVGATIIDGLVLIPIAILLVIGAVAGSSGSQVVFTAAAYGAQFAYQYLLLKNRNGQTIGNRQMKTRVVAANGGPLTTTHMARRAGFSLGLSLLMLIPSIAALASLVAIADIVFPAFDKKRQALHDKFADTLVVMA
jgi:uncharacterized RDD family membrane protein YckC